MRIRLSLFLIFSIYAKRVSANTVEQLEKRVKELENLVQQLIQLRKVEPEVAESNTCSY